jgi:hypothetical protein
MIDEELKLELERLRLAFIKIGGDKEALFRAELTLQESNTEAVKLSDATTKNGLYSLNISINTYADIDNIRKSVEKQLMTRIVSYKEYGSLDCPEAKKPEYKSGKGQISPAAQLDDAIICLKIYKLTAEGKTVPEIATNVYDNNNLTHSEKASWESDCQKVRNHLNKAKKLIEAAKNGTFPELSSTQSK